MALSIVYPVDVISRRFQVECIQQDTTPHYRDVIAAIYRESNWRGFYRGLVATYIKVIPAVSICVMTNERIKAIRTAVE